MRFLLLIRLPLPAHIGIIQVNMRIDGRLDLSVPQPLLDIAGVPPGSNELSGMTVAQQVSMKGNPTFPTVMAK